MNPRSSRQGDTGRASIVNVNALVTGDWITEVDTPDGPWYLVLNVDEHHLTLDGRADPGDDELPVSLPKHPRGAVLRRSEWTAIEGCRNCRRDAHDHDL